MKERVSGFFETLKTMWQNASKAARIVFLAVTGAILVFCLVMVWALNRTNDLLLFNIHSMSAQDSAAAFAALNEAGIDAKLDNITGAVYVTERDINRARIQLASQGYSTAGLDYATYNSTAGSLTATSSDKKIAEVHDLQDRLQAAIESYDEVNQAIVTINMPSNNNYALDASSTPASASIKISKRPGANLSREQVQAFINIVKFAVPGLTEEYISIADETGDLKTYLENTSASSASKLELTEQVNNSVRENILTMLRPVYGSEHVTVAVQSRLNNNQEVREENRYEPFDPENPQNNPLESAEYYREKVGGGDPAAQGVPGATDNTDVPQYNTGDMNLDDADYYTANDTLNYLVSSVREQIIKEGYDIEDMTVAVIIDSDALSQQDRDKVIDIVSSASGVTSDKVSVQNMKFNTNATTPLPSEVMGEEELNRVLLIAGTAIMALLVLLVLLFLHLRNKKKQAALLAAGGTGAEGYEGGLVYDEDGSLLVDLTNQEDDFEPITLGETTEQKLKAQIKDLAENDPEVVAQLLKTWLVQS